MSTWSRRGREEIRQGVARGMESGGKVVTQRVQKEVERALKIRRKGFVKTYRHRVYSSKPERMPSLAVGSKIFFSGMLEHGGTISAKKRLMLIPFGNLRIGPKAWRALIRNLMSRGDGYFRQVGGRLILFAENIAENDRDLRKFKRGERTRRGVKSLKRGTDIPVAVAVRSVTIRKKTDVLGVVKKSLGEVVFHIESELARGTRGR